MKKVTKTKSDHARKLFGDGHSTAEVARIANINYGHAWNIRKGMLAKT
jgi:DNA-binding CsgD family transcriptional regulator